MLVHHYNSLGGLQQSSCSTAGVSPHAKPQPPPPLLARASEPTFYFFVHVFRGGRGERGVSSVFKRMPYPQMTYATRPSNAGKESDTPDFCRPGCVTREGMFQLAATAVIVLAFATPTDRPRIKGGAYCCSVNGVRDKTHGHPSSRFCY